MLADFARGFLQTGLSNACRAMAVRTPVRMKKMRKNKKLEPRFVPSNREML
jgi:hypothetical protein